MHPELDYEAVSILELLKRFINASPTLTQLKNMKTQRTLDVERVKEFVGDFNKLFEDLKAWTKDAKQIRTWRGHFLEKYPEIFDDSSENEVKMETEVATTMETEVETKPFINREEKLRGIGENKGS